MSTELRANESAEPSKSPSERDLSRKVMIRMKLVRIRELFVVGAVAVCGLMIGIVGCGEAGPAKGLVKGQVLLKGQPLLAGSVIFYSPETGISSAVDLTSEGSFQLPDGLPLGTYRVAVFPPTPVENGQPGTSVPPSPVKIPRAYMSETTTPLMATVEQGENIFPLAVN